MFNTPNAGLDLHIYWLAPSQTEGSRYRAIYSSIRIPISARQAIRVVCRASRLTSSIPISLLYAFLAVPAQKMCTHEGKVNEMDSSEYYSSMFHAHGDYMTLDHSYDHVWEEMNRNHFNGGIIWSADGIESGNETIGAIAMFHQLHCLTRISKALQDSRDGLDIGLDKTENRHWPHCLDYLRQVKNLSFLISLR
jgi:hypothetical protein